MYDFNLLDLIVLEKMVLKEYWEAKEQGQTSKYNDLSIILNKITAQKINFGLEV